MKSSTSEPQGHQPQKLREAVARLHSQLAGTPRVDDAAAKALRDVLADIERLLRQRADGTHAGQPDEHRHRLERLEVDFETDHPTLAAGLRQLIDMLGRSGV